MYVLRRLPSLLATLFAVSLLTFLTTSLLPGDPALQILGAENATPEAIAAVRADLGLDDPLPVRYLHWIGRDRLAVMGYDLDDLLADLDSLPTSYRRIGSDVGRGCWGLVRDLSEPKILRQKLQKLPAWNRIHVHK